MDLLPLSHGDGPALQFELLAEALNGIGGVRAHGEEADERGARGALSPGLLQVQDHALCIPGTHSIRYVLSGLGQSAVRTPTPVCRAEHGAIGKHNSAHHTEYPVHWLVHTLYNMCRHVAKDGVSARWLHYCSEGLA